MHWKHMVAGCVAAVGVCVGLGTDVAFAEFGSGPQLVKVVVLSRHGVRAPTQSRETLEGWSAHPWPEWPVRSGELTPRGAALVTALWEQEGAVLRQEGLLPQGCPPAGFIVVRTDPEQRTQVTGEAILAGLVPECGVKTVQSPQRPDPLFHPVEAGICGYPAEQIQKDIPQSSLDALEASLASPLGELGALAGTASPAFCRKYGLPEGCSFVDVPSRFRVDRGALHLEGRLGIASSLAEILLLEYGQRNSVPEGQPAEAAGAATRAPAWGRVDRETLQRLLPVHSQVFDLVGRAPSVVGARGSALLLTLADVLAGQSTDPALNAAKLVVFVGHDTNLAAVGGLLDLDWKLPGYAPREIPPASALVLRLWQDQGALLVRVSMIGQSLEDLHAPKPLGGLVQQELTIPWCDARVEASPCTLTDFGLLVREVLFPQCVPSSE